MCKCLIKNTHFGKVQVFLEDYNNLTKFFTWLTYLVNVKSTGGFCQIWTSPKHLFLIKNILENLNFSGKFCMQYNKTAVFLKSNHALAFEQFMLIWLCCIWKLPTVLFSYHVRHFEIPNMYPNCLKNIIDIFSNFSYDLLTISEL